MAGKISELTLAVALANEDLFEIAEWNGATFDSRAITYATLVTALNADLSIDTIYTADGTLTGDRTVDLDGFDLGFITGNIGLGIAVPTARAHVKSSGLLTEVLLVEDILGADLMTIHDDGRVIVHDQLFVNKTTSPDTVFHAQGNDKGTATFTAIFSNSDSTEAMHIRDDLAINIFGGNGNNATVSIRQRNLSVAFDRSQIMDVYNNDFTIAYMRMIDNGASGEILFNNSDFNINTYTDNVGLGATAASEKMRIKASASGDIFAVLPVSGSAGFYVNGNVSNEPMVFLQNTSASTTVRVHAADTSWFNGGLVGFGHVSPSVGRVHIEAGTTALAPLRFNEGTLMTSADDGCFEYASAQLWFTPDTVSPLRHLVELNYPVVQTAAGPYTMTKNDRHVCVNQTVSAAITINLPASPVHGERRIVSDGKGDSATYNITVGRNGNNIDGAAADATINVAYNSLTFEFITGYGWKKI